MPRFFIKKEQIHRNGSHTQIVIDGNDAVHISRSLRMRVGDELIICDGDGREYICTLSKITDSEVTANVAGSRSCTSEPPYKVTVYQALVKGEKFDTVVQKSIECGAVSVVPFSSSRCTVKLKGSDVEKKRARWQRIAEEAAKQCGRGIIPNIATALTFDEMINNAAKSDIVLFCYEKETLPLKATLAEKKANGVTTDISVIIGSEGGFSEEEAHAAKSAGFSTVSLGKRILRTESAAPFVLACLSYELEE